MSKPYTESDTCPQCEESGQRAEAIVLTNVKDAVGWCENGHVFIYDARLDKPFLAYNFAS